MLNSYDMMHINIKYIKYFANPDYTERRKNACSARYIELTIAPTF